MKKNFIFYRQTTTCTKWVICCLAIFLFVSVEADQTNSLKKTTPQTRQVAQIKSRTVQVKKSTRRPAESNKNKAQLKQEKQNRLKFLLNSLPQICRMQKTFEEKVAYMDKTMKELHTLSRELVNKYGVFELALGIMNATEDNVNNFITAEGIAITSDTVKEVDLRRGFTLSYAQYNSEIKYNSPVEDFTDQWARQIYYGLDCLYKACGKDCSS